MACKSTEYFNSVVGMCTPIAGVSATGTSAKSSLGIVDTIASNLGSTLVGASSFITALKGGSTAPTINNNYESPTSGSGNMLLIVGVIVIALLAFLMMRK